MTEGEPPPPPGQYARKIDEKSIAPRGKAPAKPPNKKEGLVQEPDKTAVLERAEKKLPPSVYAKGGGRAQPTPKTRKQKKGHTGRTRQRDGPRHFHARPWQA